MNIDKTKKLITSWDTCDIAEHQAEYIKELAKEDGEELSDDDAFNRACGDSGLMEFEWECLCGHITEAMKAKNKTDRWRADVSGFGWRKQDGYKEFTASDGRELLSEILPKTDCTFNVYHFGKNGIAIENAHHDAPVGGEWYYIKPMKEVA